MLCSFIKSERPCQKSPGSVSANTWKLALRFGKLQASTGWFATINPGETMKVVLGPQHPDQKYSEEKWHSWDGGNQMPACLRAFMVAGFPFHFLSTIILSCLNLVFLLLYSKFKNYYLLLWWLVNNEITNDKPIMFWWRSYFLGTLCLLVTLITLE